MSVRIVAELCQNHRGDFGLVKEMAEQAVVAGATHVKIQHIYAKNLSFRPQFEEGLIREGKTLSIKRPWKEEYERLKALELCQEENAEFVVYVRSLGAIPLTTCFARADVADIKTAGFDTVKVASYDCASYQLLRELADSFDELFVSTGATFDDELTLTSNLLKARAKRFALLHCVTLYPTALEDVHLARLNLLRRLAPSVGFSDHSLVKRDGILASMAALFHGADLIERHFTILESDETKDGPVSVGPSHVRELREFAACSRIDQRRVLDERLPDWEQVLLGSSKHDLNEAELLNRDYYRGRFASRRDGFGNRASEMIFNWEETPV